MRTAFSCRVMTMFAAATGIVLVSLLVTSCAHKDASDWGEGDPIRIALDWTPNTNHTGLYVALNRGYFADAGLNVEVLPYNDASPETLIDSGRAEFGVGFQSSLTAARAAGAEVTSVFAVLQRRATGIAVREDSEIQRPRDLDGKTYAGFGDLGEQEMLRQTIRNDGGQGKFDFVQLGMAAYEAVYSGKADFTVSFIAWEGIEAKHSGYPMRYFNQSYYGIPDVYAVLIAGSDPWLEKNPEAAKKFIAALHRGYQFSADQPDQAADILVKENSSLLTDSAIVNESQWMLASHYMRDAQDRIGLQNVDQWRLYGNFLYENGLLADDAGRKLTTEPDWAAFFTNDYLPPELTSPSQREEVKSPHAQGTVSATR